ncbi:MAG: hypothetical protein F6K55_07890 [Moorea sp. SIO4A3]|nr:hypothetical protein [Moorena sp. SIO4A3]
MPVLLLGHRQDACSTVGAQARCLFYFWGTGKMPVLLLGHRQDAYSTLGAQARCLFYHCLTTFPILLSLLTILPVSDSKFAHSKFQILNSLLPAPCSLLPAPYSLFPVPCSLKSQKFITEFRTPIK